MDERLVRVSRRSMLSLLGGGAGMAWLAHGCASAVPQPIDDAAVPHHCLPTTSDVEGPYYLAGAPNRMRIAEAGEPGERLVIAGTVLGPDCSSPLRGALVDVWQADKDGIYHGSEAGYRLRGTLLTRADGSYEFETIMPGAYALGTGFRPAHIHFMVTLPGHTSLTTQLYFEGDPYLPPNDACGTGCNSDEPDRVISLSGNGLRRGVFDIVLAKG